MKVIAWPAFKTRYKNPYNWLLYSNMPVSVTVTEFSALRLLCERFDVFHLHWPVETLVRHPNIWVARLRVIAFWMLLKLSKFRGTKIMWTIHDEKPHVVIHQALADWFQMKLIANTDGYINLCAAGKRSVETVMAGLKCKAGFVIPHGHYREYYADDMTQVAARSHFGLSLDTKTLLYLGYISPYKNVLHLVKTFQQMSASEKNIALLVAGKPDNCELETAIRTAAEDNLNIQLHLRFVKEEELQIFFKAADWVVLPFEEILNSGSLLLALSFDRPVIAPDMGAISDWKARLGEEWIRTYTGALIPEILIQAMDTKTSDLGQAPLDFLNWEVIAQQTVAAYQLMGAKPKEQTVSTVTQSTAEKATQ